MGTSLEPIGGRRPSQAEIDAQCLYLRTERDYKFHEIASEMGLSLSGVHKRVRRAYARLPGPKASEQKAADLAALDELERVAWSILESTHLTISEGHAVYVKVTDADGVEHKIPVPDHGPQLAALDRILKVQERRTKLLGNDAPVRHRVQVIPQDAVDAELADLKRELALDEDDDSDLADLL